MLSSSDWRSLQRTCIVVQVQFFLAACTCHEFLACWFPTLLFGISNASLISVCLLHARVFRAREVGAHICYGIVRRVTANEARDAEPGSSPFRICQVVVRPDGVLQCSYDKLHLCHYGQRSPVFTL